MCESTESRPSAGKGGCSCGCCGCGCGSFSRRFFTRAEELQSLEAYKERLTKELAALEERIKEARGCSGNHPL